MSINSIIACGVLVFVIGIVIGTVCGRQGSESLFDRINSSLHDKFSSLERFYDYKIKDTTDTLCNLSRLIANFDQSNIEKNKNTQLERVVKIITEELNKIK